jgi:hypothetical protein
MKKDKVIALNYPPEDCMAFINRLRAEVWEKSEGEDRDEMLAMLDDISTMCMVVVSAMTHVEGAEMPLANPDGGKSKLLN